MSPTSVKVSLEQLRRGRGLSLEDALAMELRIARRCLEGADFYEGVRALLVDKTGAPKWAPAQLEGVSDESVSSYFALLDDAEELLPASRERPWQCCF